MVAGLVLERRPEERLSAPSDQQQVWDIAAEILTLQRRNIADALAMPTTQDIAFEPPRADINVRPADFS